MFNEQQELLDELNPDEGIDMGTMEDDDDFLNNDNFGVRSEEKYISITATATVRALPARAKTSSKRYFRISRKMVC